MVSRVSHVQTPAQPGQRPSVFLCSPLPSLKRLGEPGGDLLPERLECQPKLFERAGADPLLSGAHRWAIGEDEDCNIDFSERTGRPLATIRVDVSPCLLQSIRLIGVGLKLVVRITCRIRIIGFAIIIIEHLVEFGWLLQLYIGDIHNFLPSVQLNNHPARVILK